MVNYILTYISIFLAVLLVLPMHEFAHAFTAVKCGDDTPKLNRRLTLNPLAHFDILGLVCFVLFKFGWAKPVPINPNNFKKPRLNMFLVSIAGVLANYLFAFILYPLFILSTWIPQFGYFTLVLQNTLFYAFMFNLSFCLFNLLPIFPLDGFNAIDAFTKKRGKFYYAYKEYGIYILYFLFLLGIIADITGIIYIDVLGFVMNKAVNVIKVPITAFWGLIF